MIRRFQSLSGFSLVEVVLAIGILTFALIAIFGLFGSSLRSKAETLSQQEVLALTRSFAGMLGNPEFSGGFTNVYAWVRQTNTMPEILAFLNTQGTFRLGQATDAAFLQEAETRNGRLFRIVPSLSPNMPLQQANGSWIPRPKAADLPANPAEFTNHSRLPLQIRVFEVGSPGLSLDNRVPILTYETALARF